MNERSPDERIEPFYFGQSSSPLFGCYHPPVAGQDLHCGVVLCQPVGHEYERSHRAFRQWAIRLSGIGCSVLRFDYFGCGDSAGDLEQARIDRWLADTSAAVDEVRGRQEVQKIYIAGLRLGASLAFLTAAARRDVSGLVLWEPVVDGVSYVHNLEAAHRKMLQYAHIQARPRALGSGFTEIIGFPFSDLLLADIQSLNLLAVEQKAAGRALVIEWGDTACQNPLVAHLQHWGTQVEHQQYLAPESRPWIEDVASVLVPHQILQFAVGWMAEGAR